MEFWQSPAFWFDIICIAIFISFCARYVHLGFLAAVVQICGTAISLIGAHVFASFADSWVYETFFEASLTQRVETLMAENSENGIEALSQTLLELMPESLLTLWQGSVFEPSALSLAGNVDAVTASLMDGAVAPVVTQMIFMVLFVGAFLVCRILIFVLVKALRAANYIPVIGGVNRVLGWLFGTVGAAVDIYLLFCVLWMFILLSNDMMPVLNTADLSTSFLFTLFQTYSPFM